MNHGAREEIKIVPAKTLEEIIFENFGFLFGKPMPTTTTTTPATANPLETPGQGLGDSGSFG